MTNGFIGEWNTAWTSGHEEATRLTIHSDGSAVYDTSDGRLEGKFSVRDSSYSGKWIQSNDSGTFTFVLQGDSIFGVWTNKSGGGGGLWNGSRVE